MMNQFLTDVKGFTPLIDALCQEVGLVTAAVYGVIWRYCQMSDGVCKASQETIGKHLGLTRQSVHPHMVRLCECGYLRDLTPDLSGKPHIYADTGRARIMGMVEARVSDREQRCQESLQDDLSSSITPPVKNHDTTCNDSLHNESIKKEEKKEEREANASRAAVPAPKRERTISAQERQQQAIRTALREHFERVTNIPIPEKGNTKGLGALWWNPIRQICEMTEYDLPRAKRLVTDTVTHMEREHLTISSPKSIVQVAVDFARKETRPPVVKQAGGMVVMPVAGGKSRGR
jgi:DNA-binding MarR family transcriptional regulator